MTTNQPIPARCERCDAERAAPFALHAISLAQERDPMSLDISPKTEAALVAKAQEKGLSIDAFLGRLIIDAGPCIWETATARLRNYPSGISA